MAIAPTTCTPPVDDLSVRSGKGVGPWTLDKLDILAAYLPAFASACSGTPGWYYVDDFAGPGVNVLPDGSGVCGSPLIALETEPEFAKCLFMDEDERIVATLRARTTEYSDRREAKRRPSHDRDGDGQAGAVTLLCDGGTL